MSATATDRELLKLAAKAAGIKLQGWAHESEGCYFLHMIVAGKPWNPLTDDGDALRLSVALNICTLVPLHNGKHERIGAGQVGSETPACFEPYLPDPNAAMRRAIVNAAAEIGRGLASQPDTEKTNA